MPRISLSSANNLPKDFEELVHMHPPYAIHDEVSYENTQELIDLLTSLPKLSKGQMLYLDTLTTLFEVYENEHYPIDADMVEPVDILKALLEAHDMNASDLGRLLGERTLGPKILNGQRELSKAHIRILADHFNVSPALFL